MSLLFLCPRTAPPPRVAPYFDAGAVVCEVPKLAPHKAEMERRLTEAAGGPVTVKGRRAEGLGAIGRREGIACWAVAVITRLETGASQ